MNRACAKQHEYSLVTFATSGLIKNQHVLPRKRLYVYAQWLRPRTNIASWRLKNNSGSVVLIEIVMSAFYDCGVILRIQFSERNHNRRQTIGGFTIKMSVELPVTCRLSQCGDQSYSVTLWRHWVCFAWARIWIVLLKRTLCSSVIGWMSQLTIDW